MESKEKEIEEMMLTVPQKIVAFDMTPKGQHLYGEQRKEIAEALYNAGYRKTFTSELASDSQKAHKDGYKKGLNSKLTSDFVMVAQKIAVEKFAEKLKRECHNFYSSIDHYCCSEKAIKLADIDKLLKEFLE